MGGGIPRVIVGPDVMEDVLACRECVGGGIGPGPGRMIGMVLTLFSLVGFAAAMFWGALVHG